MYVVKRDGRQEAVHFDKITAHLKKLSYGLSIEHCDPVLVAQKVCAGVYKGVTTSQLDELAAETAAAMTANHPDYAPVKIMYNHVNERSGLESPLIADDVYEIIMQNAACLDSEIIYDRDFDYDYFGFKTLERPYLLKVHGKVVERPQHMLMRVAVGIHKNDINTGCNHMLAATDFFSGHVFFLARKSLSEQLACNKTFYHLFSQSLDIYNLYIEELKEARIQYKDSPELLWFLMEFLSTSKKSSSLFEQCKPTFLDIYLKAVLNAREKPAKGLSEAFRPLFRHMSHEDFQNVVLPSSVKMLKRNPEIVLESVGILLKSVNLDLSKYALEILSLVLPQARHADEARRVPALEIVRCLSQSSSNPDAIEAMFNAVKSVLGGSEGRLAFPYQRIGMIGALQELCNAPDGKHLNKLSQTSCNYLRSCYKEDGNEEVKLAILSALGSWAARSPDVIQSDLVSFLSSGLKEKEGLRRGHLRCLRVIGRNTEAVYQLSSLLEPLLQLVKTGFTKVVQRLDDIYALLLVGKIAAADIKAEETVVKEKTWALISQNEPSGIPISLASKLSTEDRMACVDLLEVFLVEHLQRVLDSFSVRSLSQLLIFFM